MDANRRLRTYTFPGGWITGRKGLLDYLFGTLSFEWSPTGTDGPRKRPYGSRQRANAQAGERIRLTLDTGDVYSVRTNATHKVLVAEIINKAGDKVEEVTSELGTLYTKRTPVAAP